MENFFDCMSTRFISASEADFIVQGISIKSGIRSDGRERMDQRQMYMEIGLYPQASGSCRVSIDGGTDVLVGVRAAVGDPIPVGNDIVGDKGRVYVSIEWYVAMRCLLWMDSCLCPSLSFLFLKASLIPLCI